MIIKALVENTALSERFGSEHGLSLYIETSRQKLMFDVGASDLFLNNAALLDVDISSVDALVISHGHADHGGGLKPFLKVNNSAKIYLHPLAFEPHYAARPNDAIKYIGLDGELKAHRQVILTDERHTIDVGVELFSNVAQCVAAPKSNKGLFVERGGLQMRDSFEHEQNLVVADDGKVLLITGCAHNGIVNIVKHFETLYKRLPDVVIGGFHLSSRSGGSESDAAIDEIAKYLLTTGAMYYTCHCTGSDAYHRLKQTMGERIDYLAAGRVIKI